MVKILEEFPRVHATFNFVPLLAEQIEEYVGGRFQEPWFDIAFAHAGSLQPEQKREALERAFQVTKISSIAGLASPSLRPSCALAERKHASRTGPSATGATCKSSRSSPGWTRNISPRIPSFTSLSEKGKNFSEEDKSALLEKQQELLAAVLPEYRQAAARGQIEISTTPYYHPILPLLCDTDIARVSNPHTPLPHPAFRYPQDAREQLVRARNFHERVFGKPPVGLWPSEGSVSDQALEIAMDLASNGLLLMKEFSAALETKDSGASLRLSRKRSRPIHSVAPRPGREASHRFFPRSLPVGPSRLRLQPHGS